MKHLFILFLATSFVSTSIFGIEKIDFQQALKKKNIEMKVEKVKGYKGRSLLLRVSNLRSDSVHVIVPAGWVFDSDDSSKQNLIVVNSEEFVLASKKTESKWIQINCCQRFKSSPSGSSFSGGFQHNAQLTELATFLDEFEYKEQTICNAVWAISDNFSIASICGSGDSKDEKLREKVAAIKKKNAPWYSIKTEDLSTKSGHIETHAISIYGSFDCPISIGTAFQVKLVDVKGREIMQLAPLVIMDEHKQVYDLDLSVAQLPQKEYYLSFEDAYGVRLFKKEIDLKL